MSIKILFASLQNILLINQIIAALILESFDQSIVIGHEQITHFKYTLLVVWCFLYKFASLFIHILEDVDGLSIKNRVNVLWSLKLSTYFTQVGFEEFIVINIDFDHLMHVACEKIDTSPVVLGMFFKNWEIILSDGSFWDDIFQPVHVVL